MSDWLILVGLLVICLTAVVLTAIRLPGPWLVVAAAFGTAWLTEWQAVGWWTLAGLIALAVVAEILEVLMSVITARKAGASKKAAWGGLIGGFVGMLVLTVPIPIPGVGTVIGAVLGCFLGAMIGEHLAQKGLEQSARVGVFAATGFVLGAMVKLTAAMAMSGLLVSMYVFATWFGSTPTAAAG